MRKILIRALAGALAVAGCGREGFDRLSSPDAAPPAPDAPPVVLACNASPPRVEMTAPATAFAVTPNGTGYDLILVDGSMTVHGFAYELASGAPMNNALTTTQSDVPIAANATGALSAAAAGGGVLGALTYGSPAQGTLLFPLDGSLAARGSTTMLDGLAIGSRSLAAGADGSIALLTQSLATNDISAKLVSPLGAALPAPQQLAIDHSDAPGAATIIPAGDQYLVTWNRSSGSPIEVRAEVLDSQLGIRQPSTLISFDGQNNSSLPSAAYLASADRFLFAWYEKTGTGDQLWISLRNSDLSEQHKPFLMPNPGTSPQVVAGKDDFLVVWQNGMTLNAARVSADGVTVTSKTPENLGGDAVAWSLVVRDGQPALVWLESTCCAPPNLWVDPLCN